MARLGRRQPNRPIVRRGAAPAAGNSPVFETSSTLAGATSGSAAVPVPSGVAADDVIVVASYLEASNAVTPPSGFTEKANATAGPSEIWQRVFWKRATGGDTGTYTFTFTSTFSEWHALRISNCITSGDPWDATNTAATDSSSTSPAVSVTTTVTDTLLVWSATSFTGGDAWTPPGGFTERTDLASATTATLAQAAAGSTGSLTGTTGGAADSMTAFLGALKPPAAPVAAYVPVLVSQYAGRW